MFWYFRLQDHFLMFCIPTFNHSRNIECKSYMIHLNTSIPQSDTKCNNLCFSSTLPGHHRRNLDPSLEGVIKLSSILLGPESPTLVREDFRHSFTAAGVAVIFFDFDGTLTATPGDRAARRTKQLELCERAPMLAPRLKSLCADGASLGIISKSTETCRDWSPSGRDCQVQKKFLQLFVLHFTSDPRKL